MVRKTRLRTSAAVIAVVAVLATAFAVGNAAAQSTASTSGDAQEVIVQAQRREQKLTDVPMAVEVLSSQRLAAAHVSDAKDMQILTPGLIVDTTLSPGNTTARIRGIGTVGDNPGLESSVGIVVDGVYRPRNSSALDDQLDLDHVEVIKGPQGTLYGKNTTAGLISAYSKAPSFIPAGEVAAGVGNFGESAASFRVTGPLLDQVLAGSLTVSHDQHEGYDKVVATAPRTSTSDDTLNSNSAKAQLLAIPSQDLSIRLIADYNNASGQCCLAVQTVTGPTGQIIDALGGGNAIALQPDVNKRTAYSNQPDPFSSTDEGVTILTDIRFPGLDNTTLSSITGLRHSKNDGDTDIDYTSADILSRPPGSESFSFDSGSQEFRFHHAGAQFDQLGGVFLSYEDLTDHEAIQMGAAYEPYLSLLLSGGQSTTFVSALTGLAPGQSFAAGSGEADNYRQHDRTEAAYYNVNWKPAEAIELIAGIRYTADQKSFIGHSTNSAGNVGCAAGLNMYAHGAGAWPFLSPAQQQGAVGALCLFWANAYFNGLTRSEAHDESNVSGTAKAIYHLDTDQMVYAAWSTGYKAGGFNLDRSTTGITPDSSAYFPKETIDAIEVGYKGSLLDHHLNLNVTPFIEQLHDFQLNTFLGTAYVVETIPRVTTKGVDADAHWRTPVSGLSLDAGVTLNDAKYGSFSASQLISPAQFPDLSLLPGNQVGLAAKTSATLGGTWESHLGLWPTSLSLSAKYSSPYVAGSDLLPAKTQKGYTIANASWSLQLPGRHLTLTAWVKNIANVTIKETVIAAPLQGTGFQTTVQPGGTYYNPALDSNTYAAFLAPPRTFGVTLTGRF